MSIEKENTGKDVASKVENIEIQKKLLDIEQNLLIQKGLESNNPMDILKSIEAVGIKTKENDDNRKTTLIDLTSNFGSGMKGYRDVPKKISYGTLFNMSRVPVINAILKTRKSQVSAFTEPTDDMFSTGFRIIKKGYKGSLNEMNRKDRQTIDDITEFILNCGINQSWGRDDFSTMMRKCTEDSLVYDQLCFEVVRDRKGVPHEFYAVDGSSIRLSDAYDMRVDDYEGEAEMINGYYPHYVQVLEDKVKAEYYPWELCFGIRNPVTSVYSNGYGRSELEEMVSTITSLLWSDEYNSNFFRVGASPKGILRIKGGTNNPRIQSFRQQWQSMVSGVSNSWKTPVIDSESMEWIDLQKSHRDMEFKSYQEYLVRTACAIYTIAPEEIGFQSGGFQGGSSMMEGSSESRLKYSRDKGLNPLLKFWEGKLNKMIVSQLNPNFKLEFVGVDTDSKQENHRRVLDEVTHYRTINEIRREKNLDPIDGGDIILNPTFIQSEQQNAMMNQMGEQGGGEDYEQDNVDKADVSPFIYDLNAMTEKLEKGEL